ncbi:MAG: PKD-like family lipoprotein [Marinifilaceae bacterium]
MKYIYISILVMVIALLSSCSQDLGNYNYNEINELEISGIDNSKWLELIAFVDTLKLNPQIDAKLNSDENNLSYKWKLIPTGVQDWTQDDDEYVVATTKNLVLPITHNAGTYIGYYDVKDLQTNQVWKTKFMVRVRSIASDCWMVLCEDKGGSRLDVISNISETEDLIGFDIWRDNDTKTSTPTGLLYLYDVGDRQSRIVSMNGQSYLMGEELEIGEEYLLKWSFGTLLDNLNITGGVITVGTRDNEVQMLATKEGDIYSRDPMSVGSLFSYPINKFEDGTRFNAAPYFGTAHDWSCSSHVILCYDNDGKQFVEFRDGAAYFAPARFSNTIAGFNTQTGRTMEFMATTRENYTFAVLKGPSDGDASVEKYYIYGMMAKANGSTSQEYYKEIDFDGTIDKFCFHSYAGIYCFFSAGNEVYQMSVGGKDAPKKIFEFPGETIKVLKFNKLLGWLKYEDWERERGQHLIIGTTVDGMDESESGIFRSYRVNKFMDPLDKLKEIKRLGSIVDIAYRERRN